MPVSSVLTANFPPPVNGPPDLLIIAGEHSGDEHAAQLLKDLLKEQPGLKVACLGGIRLKEAGAQLLYDLTAVSIVGFVEVLRHFGHFKRLFEATLEWIESYRPKHICFVDYPGFNLRIAQAMAERSLSRKGGGVIGLSYYIGPQVWAWKAKRRFKMARLLDRLAVIFPFEVECFTDTDLPTEFVGHPFVREDFKPPFVYDPNAPVLLLPGSRSAAVERILPLLLEGYRQVKQLKPTLRVIIVYPGKSILELIQSILEEFSEEADDFELIPNTGTGIAASAVLMSSGTMSLACALSGIPGAIAYRLNPLTYWLGKRLVRVKFIGMANLILNRSLYPEYIQQAANRKNLSEALLHALEDPNSAEEAARSVHELRQCLRAGDDVNPAKWLVRGLKEK